MSYDTGNVISLLYPSVNAEYKIMTDVTAHDLGLDYIVKKVTEDLREQQMIMRILTRMTASPEVAEYRQDIYDDFCRLPELRTKLLDLMNRIEYLKDYGTWRKNADEKPGLWDLLHRLDELVTYITCIESLNECLSDGRIRAKGLIDLKKYIEDLYSEGNFEAMKKDLQNVKTDASDIRSVTIGINVNQRFEAESLGLISVNSKSFRKSGIVSNFADALASRDKINDSTEWDGDMRYEPADQPETDSVMDKVDKTTMAMAKYTNPILMSSEATIAKVPDGDGTANSTFYLSNVATKMTAHLVKRLRSTLSLYSDISIVVISKLIPELIYYIRFAEFMEQAAKKGSPITKPEVRKSDDKITMEAFGFYNIKLAVNPDITEEIVTNDLTFDRDRLIYLLTGANRGGKTTLTQAVGQLFVLAQGGIHVPCSRFSYKPVDMIFTHFPADEDKTMDLGRLGEECVRFRESYSSATSLSLLLLNESFSTTSYEEGYYIAVDAVRAIRKKEIRTIYNTHMHKLASDIDLDGVSSIVMASEGGKRSYKVIEKAPEGSSYARDIAARYGVTYEMLTGDQQLD